MGQYTYGGGAAQSGGGYAGMSGPQNQTQQAKRGLVVRDKSGKTLSDIEYRTALGRGDELSAAWEEEPAEAPAPSMAAPEAPVTPTPDPVAPPAGGGESPAMQGLRGAVAGGTNAGWADEPAMAQTASSLGGRTPPMAVTTLSEIMRRFGRTY